jgi:peptidoglycan/xylan/chitin deacetylase (PgdA/CDA1 family)
VKAAVPILTFHTLENAPSVLAFSPALFADFMGALFVDGFRTIDLLDISRSIIDSRTLPERSFVITFDDGYQSVHEHAFPVLQRFGFGATVFLTVGEAPRRTDAQRLPSLEQRPMLSWAEIREMDRAGISFGAHTLTHPDLRRLSFDNAYREISVSKQTIENALGKPVHSFAYPYGRYDEKSRGIVRERFVCACSDELGIARSSSDPFALERVDAYYLREKRCSSLMLTPFFASYIRLRNIPRRIRRACHRD